MNLIYTITKLFRKHSMSMVLAGMSIILSSCEEFVKIDPPRTDLIKSTTFSNDPSAQAAMTDIYYSMHFNGFASGDVRSLTFLGALSGDEMIDYSSSDLRVVSGPFNTNTLTPQNEAIMNFWSELYSLIYRANSIIEGVSLSPSLSDNVRIQLEGEAKFIRAFCYFYLVNLWGDIPLAINTNYQENASLSRTGQGQIYSQIIQDLIEAEELLPADYAHAKNERSRPNRFAAAALLARVYLYTGDWNNAEAEATKVIDAGLYSLEADLSKVFYKTSNEAIWQFHSANDTYPQDIFTFFMFGTPPTWGALRPEFKDNFEIGDLRSTQWISKLTSESDEDFYFPVKYNSFDPNTEYTTLLRFAEVLLIRAEARANLDKILLAQDDLNLIRTRANLAGTTAADKPSLNDAILRERQTELFTEWGHRWLDLKRTQKIDAVLSPIKPEWKSSAALFPIPEYQVLNSPVSQNPGY